MFALALCIALVSAVTASPKNSACAYYGEFLPNPEDVCSYFRCEYGEQALLDRDGIQLGEIPHKCPFGTSTNGEEFNPYNPCSEFSVQCK